MSVDYLALLRDRSKLDSHQNATAKTAKTDFRSFCSSPPVRNEVASSAPAKAEGDTQRYCTECLNLSHAGVCRIAKPEAGALVVARRGYRPAQDILLSCKGFAGRAGANGR